MNPLVSICVPVYNVSPYLERCVVSLMRQSYGNIEYVFIDDCSTDDSLAVLEKCVAGFPQRRANTLILRNDSNHGLAYTRRKSIEEASGVYVVCVDSDDYIPEDSIQSLVDKAVETDADIVCGEVDNIRQGKYAERWRAYSPSSQSSVADAINNDFASLCAKLIKRHLFTGDFSFAPRGLDYNEDRIVCLYLSYKAKKIVPLDRVVYTYIHREGSISATRNERLFVNMMQYWQFAEQYLQTVGLGEKYRELVAKNKVKDKAYLLLHTDDMSVRKRFADIYLAETAKYRHTLHGGARMILELVSRHLWVLVNCFQAYIRVYKKLHK